MKANNNKDKNIYIYLEVKKRKGIEINMKKFLFGAILMLFGIIGGSSWLIALAIVERNCVSLLELFPECKEMYIIIVFYVIAMLGGYILIDNLDK